MLENGYWHEAPGGAFPTSLDNHASDRVSKLTSESIGSDFCADGHRLVGQKAGVDGNSSGYPLPQAENDLSFLDDPYDEKQSCDLFLDYGWPEFGNFDDIDRMFRSCDSTFGLGTSDGDDDLGWFSSLDAIDGCGEGTQPDFNLSWLSHNALKNISVTEDATELHEPCGSINCSGVTDQSCGNRYGGNLWGPENSCVPTPPPPSIQRPSRQAGPTFPDGRRAEKKKKKRIDMDGVITKAPMELDCSSMSLERPPSSRSGPNENASEEAICFHQLQHVMEGIDLKTKLCIRDSLYRLARSAEQRNGHPNVNGDIRDASGELIANTKRCVGYVDMETDTNPIDRSIAHLLFHPH